MKKNFLGKIAVSAALVVGAIAPVAAQNKVVNVYNWAEYLAEDTLPGFERTTGIKVRYDTFDTNDIVQAKLLAGNSGYDVVTPSTHYAARYIEGKLLQPFDKSKIPNFKHLDPDIMAVVAQVDPGNNYLIPWGFGTNGLGYNVTKVKEIFGADADIANWDMLFKPENASKLKECGISLLDEPAQVLPAVLHYIGKDPNSSDEKDIRAAFDVLKKIRPFIRQFSSSGYINELAAGDLCMVYGFNGDVMIAADRAKEAKKSFEVNYFIPKGGAPVWFDTMAIPADAKNVDEAHAFINYIEMPEVHAAITNKMFYPNANKSAREFVKKEIAENKQLYPDEAVSKTLFVIKPQPLKILRLETRLWADLKAGK
ncbi:polyamine ABC transporter substrate-binding protein [Taylorella equigenitalis]|uniref:Putrescine-binding periplasmic protein n=1 Tax=Taylorella equigenitalis ATCC 35865 TaxID=743973 RepID=A0ABN4AWM4_9BURK|nr:polyamine ABC transporter substrate-binding protein [Taylorella equigenitalis]AFN35801.1 putrescine ABC transporter, substrate-binding protein [Taylorella equigenitalis ATCC 35865]ASY39216.1 polyamine ABC transporter substrate-binding protein [Taylorella equigenitalis]VEG30845.1 Putrescine-binding periplasmic protein precursor [Taylorella equigenitalis ATCC 35865]